MFDTIVNINSQLDNTYICYFLKRCSSPIIFCQSIDFLRLLWSCENISINNKNYNYYGTNLWYLMIIICNLKLWCKTRVWAVKEKDSRFPYDYIFRIFLISKCHFHLQSSKFPCREKREGENNKKKTINLLSFYPYISLLKMR